jgi:hypothetical protein
MNRRQFLIVAGGSVVALGLPSTFQVPEEVPEYLPPPVRLNLPAPSDVWLRQMVKFMAFGTAEFPIPAFAVLTRPKQKQILIVHRLNAFGGMLHHYLRPGDQINEIPGYEIRIFASRYVDWVASWRCDNGEYQATAGTGDIDFLAPYERIPGIIKGIEYG